MQHHISYIEPPAPAPKSCELPPLNQHELDTIIYCDCGKWYIRRLWSDDYGVHPMWRQISERKAYRILKKRGQRA